MNENKLIIFPGEAEKLVESLKPMLPEQIGLPIWYKQQEYIDKLNMQAVLSATNKTDEFIKEFLINHQKLDVLIECLICLELWIDKVFNKLIEEKFEPKQTFGIYSILYHEATLVNLLEMILYHCDALESLDKGVVDLFDYCYRRLVYLSVIGKDCEERRKICEIKMGLSKKSDESSMEELKLQESALKFEISMKCVSIIRYFIEKMPLSISTRLYNSCDMPGLFVGLIQTRPWLVELENGKLMKFIDNNWCQQLNWLDARNSMSKLEGQIWLGIYQMLMSEQCHDKYEISNYRKGILLSLRSHLSDVVVDQLPILGDMRRFLEQLSISETPNVKSGLILEQVAEFQDTFNMSYDDNRWNQLTGKFKTYLFSSENERELQRHANAWSNMYSQDQMDQLLTTSNGDNHSFLGETIYCVVCDKVAAKRCSRCKSEWYCSRECQVSHWSKHKKACNLIVGELSETK